VTSEGTNIVFKYLRDGKEGMAYATPFKRATRWYERKALRQVLISPAMESKIFEVASNSPAAVAGLRPGDEVVAINGEKIFSYYSVLHAQEQMTNGVSPVTFTITRGTNQFDCTLVAVKPVKPGDAEPSFGILAWQGRTNDALAYPTPMEQIKASAYQIFATINTVISRKSDVGVQQLGGAVMIIRAYKNFFDSENGWRMVLWFSVLLNVNLAMLNMLPLPVLDGGHITLALVEAARRRPVGPKLLNYIQSGFAVLIIGFMLYIAFFDIGDWVRSDRRERKANEPVYFAPQK
jgi:regulator of sigma E protease